MVARMTPLASQIVGADRNVLVIQLPSHVTDEWVAQIQQEVQARLPRIDRAGVVLAFEGVELINSIGITCLLQVEEECRRRKAKLILAGVPVSIAKFLQQLKLNQRFTYAEDAESAVRTLDN